MNGRRPPFEVPGYFDENGVLTCPDCGCQDFDVYRVSKWNYGKPRERQCKNDRCRRIIMTMEVPVTDEPQ